jgi:hypothetical protein
VTSAQHLCADGLDVDEGGRVLLTLYLVQVPYAAFYLHIPNTCHQSTLHSRWLHPRQFVSHVQVPGHVQKADTVVSSSCVS